MTRPNAGPPAGELSEKELLRLVVDLAAIYGWRAYHPWLSIHSPRGWPDLALVRPPRLILAELKTRRGVLSPSQLEWGELLAAVDGVTYRVWRPADLDDGTIAEELGRR